MENKLIQLLEVLEGINEKYDFGFLNEINEQHENVTDLKDVLRDLEQVLNSIKDRVSAKEVENDLFEIHRILTTLEWHFSELTDLNMIIIKKLKGN